MQIHHAPHGYVVQVAYAASVFVSHEHVYYDSLILVGDHSYRHTVGCSHQRIAYVTSAYSRTQCILL